MQRIDVLLDVAADLLVRRGYGRVTIEDVAREAGVGKGTVYLHVRTKEALFLTVLLRAHRGVVGGMVDRMAQDPEMVLPGPMLREIYLALAADPVTRALYLGDVEAFGRLAAEAVSALGELRTRRDTGVRRQFQLLRDAGCLRTDHTLPEQLHLFGAISAGFFMADPLLDHVPDPAVRGRLLDDALRLALQEPDIPAGAAASAAPEIVATHRSLLEHLDEELALRLR